MQCDPDGVACQNEGRGPPQHARNNQAGACSFSSHASPFTETFLTGCAEHEFMSSFLRLLVSHAATLTVGVSQNARHES